MLVVGPSSVFLRYIEQVLPSLGERSVQQRTALDLCVPKVDITGVDDAEARRWKGSEEMLARLEAASVTHVKVPDDDLRVPLGSTAKAVLTDGEGRYGGIVVTAAAYHPDIAGDAPIASLATLTDDTLHPATGVEAMIAAFDAASADELAVVDDGEDFSDRFLHVGEVDQHAGFVQALALDGDADLEVVAVLVFAGTFVVAQVVRGGEGLLYGDFVHYFSLSNHLATSSRFIVKL